MKTLKFIGATGAGFAVGIFLGIAWGKKAKQNNYGSPVSTTFKDGIMNVAVDTKKAAASGLPDVLRSLF